MKKAILLPTIAVIALVVMGGVSTKQAAAFWPFDGAKTSTATQSSFSPLIQAIIDKFSLNSDEVLAVVNDYRTERQNTMEQRFEARLSEAVAAGNLTEDQKNLIVQKHEELQTQHEQDFQNRQSHRDELEKWATDNGIDISYFGYGGLGQGGGMMNGEGMGRGRNMNR